MTHGWGIASVGAVTPAGVGIPALVAALEDAAWHPQLGFEGNDAPDLAVARPAGFAAKHHIPPLVARRLDRAAGLLAVAAREAMAPLGSPPPWPGERVGVCAATWNAGTEALVEVLKAVFLAGPEEAPPAQFPSTVANAPASQLAILEKLGGPNLTFFEKQVGGLRALTEAGRLLAHRRADAVLACGVDEAQWLNAESYQRLGVLRRPGRPGMILAEGAATLVVTASPPSAPLARLLGGGSAGTPTPTHTYPSTAEALLAACRRALARAGMAAGEVELYTSMANGIPALAALESALVEQLFPAAPPAAVAISDRIGEGAFGSSLRAAVAALTLAGQVRPAWPLPTHLAERGFRLPESRPATALVAGVSGGGSAVALVLAAP